MRILVVGASGLIGSHLLAKAARLGDDSAGTTFGQQAPGLRRFDSGDTASFEALLDDVRPDAVVHTAGFTWADGCEAEPERAMELNCRQPVELARRCHARGIRFAYFSSSYVFDGTNGPYDERAIPNPINVYGRTKAAAETELQRVTDGAALVLRVICVFGAESRRKNFACQVCDAMRAGRVMTLPSDQLGNPTWAGDIARATVDILAAGAAGIFHLGGHDAECDRMKWAQRLVDSFHAVGVVPSQGFMLVPMPTARLGQRAARPLQGGVVSARLEMSTFKDFDWSTVCRDIAADPS